MLVRPSVPLSRLLKALISILTGLSAGGDVSVCKDDMFFYSEVYFWLFLIIEAIFLGLSWNRAFLSWSPEFTI